MFHASFGGGTVGYESGCYECWAQILLQDSLQRQALLLYPRALVSRDKLPVIMQPSGYASGLVQICVVLCLMLTLQQLHMYGMDTVVQ
jgi:hypothetical protein